MSRVVFVTGTNTGAGKTILTALLLAHLRSNGVHALAMKPVETGGRRDARLLHALQRDEVSLEEVNPFWFREPLAPSIAARRSHGDCIKKTYRHFCKEPFIFVWLGEFTKMANNIEVKDLLDAGVHFGHLTRKWNPNMAPYIYMERNGIHVIN